MTSKCVWVVGGDHRQSRLAELLAKDGHCVKAVALADVETQFGVELRTDFTGIDQADCVVLPLPAMTDSLHISTPQVDSRLTLEGLMMHMTSNQLICAGMVNKHLESMAEIHQIHLVDYYQREELVVANAVPTAEGAVQIALEKLPVTLWQCPVVVLGFGRVGRITAHRMASIGAKVTVAARKWSDLAWAQTYGYGVVRLDGDYQWLREYSLVINTVPEKLLNQSNLEHLDYTSLVIDLASKPGGVDFDLAEQLGVEVVWALALPGKVAPVTAGRILADTLYHILEE